MGDSAKKQVKPAENQSKLGTFFKGVKSEYAKITWPDRQATVKQSVAVVIISLVVGVLIAVLDYIFQYGVNFLTSL